MSSTYDCVVAQSIDDTIKMIQEYFEKVDLNHLRKFEAENIKFSLKKKWMTRLHPTLPWDYLRSYDRVVLEKAWTDLLKKRYKTLSNTKSKNYDQTQQYSSARQLIHATTSANFFNLLTDSSVSTADLIRLQTSHALRNRRPIKRRKLYPITQNNAEIKQLTTQPFSNSKKPKILIPFDSNNKKKGSNTSTNGSSTKNIKIIPQTDGIYDSESSSEDEEEIIISKNEVKPKTPINIPVTYVISPLTERDDLPIDADDEGVKKLGRNILVAEFDIYERKRANSIPIRCQQGFLYIEGYGELFLKEFYICLDWDDGTITNSVTSSSVFDFFEL